MKQGARDIFVLRRSFQPYIALTIILSGVTLLQLVISIKIHSWNPLVAASIIWLIFAGMVFIGTRYRILLKGSTIVQKAFGKPDVAIDVDEISAIKSETSSAGTLVRLRRPFRRITIYSWPNTNFIDVSLKHFLAEDVQTLMTKIRSHRPDLKDLAIKTR